MKRYDNSQTNIDMHELQVTEEQEGFNDEWLSYFFLLVQKCLLSIYYETGVLHLYPSVPPTCGPRLCSWQDAAGHW